MQTASVTLLKDASATGDWLAWPGGRGVFCVVGTFAMGGVVSLEVVGPDGATPIVKATVTANSAPSFEHPPGQIRAVVFSATGVYASADRLPG